MENRRGKTAGTSVAVLARMVCDILQPDYAACIDRMMRESSRQAADEWFAKHQRDQEEEDAAYQKAFRLRNGIGLQLVVLGKPPAIVLGPTRGRYGTGAWFEIGKAPLPATDGGVFTGVRYSFDAGPTTGVYLPLLGLELAWAGGVYTKSARFADASYSGSGSAMFGAMEILGLGYRASLGSAMIGFSVRPGVAFVSAGGRMTRDGLTISTEGVARSFLMRAEIELCLKTGKHHKFAPRACATVAPQYVFEQIEGAAIGLRVDLR
jgi:hypothetical protein